MGRVEPTGEEHQCEAPPGPRGRDEPADVARLRAAAERGDPDGRNGLGVRYRDGRGVARDDAEAVRWFRKAAEQGHDRAKQELARPGRALTRPQPIIVIRAG